MKRLSLLVCCLVVGPAFGQAGPEVLGRYQPSVRAADTRQMTEDIEIMRRILGRAIGEFVGPSIGWRNNRARSDMNRIWTDFLVAPDQTSSGAGRPNTATPWLSADGNYYPPFDASRNVVVSPHAAAAPEGAYLKGYGVVYSVTLPGTPVWPEDKAASPAPNKPQTEWDRIRQELHGEKPKKAEAPAPKSPRLSEVLLKLLAENGRHFTQLAPEEKLTIVVTFRPEDDTAALRSAAQDFQAIFTTQPLLAQEGLNAINQPLNVINPPSGPNPSTPPAPGAAAPPSSVKDFELLGDLQSRQGKYQEAIEAYKKALELSRSEAQQRDLSRRLVQTYLNLSAKSDDEKMTHLRTASELLAQILKKEKAPQPTAPKAAPLPSRLVVSAPKRLLDAVAAGQISFEEFRRGATIEMIRPSHPAAPKGGSPSN